MPRGNPLTEEEKAERLEKSEERAFLKKAACAAKAFREANDYTLLSKDSVVKARSGWLSEKRKRDEAPSPSKRVKCGGKSGGHHLDSLGFFAVKGPLARYLRATAAESRKGSKSVIDLTEEEDKDKEDDSDDSDDQSLLEPIW